MIIIIIIVNTLWHEHSPLTSTLHNVPVPVSACLLSTNFSSVLPTFPADMLHNTGTVTFLVYSSMLWQHGMSTTATLNSARIAATHILQLAIILTCKKGASQTHYRQRDEGQRRSSGPINGLRDPWGGTVVAAAGRKTTTNFKCWIYEPVTLCCSRHTRRPMQWRRDAVSPSRWWCGNVPNMKYCAGHEEWSQVHG